MDVSGSGRGVGKRKSEEGDYKQIAMSRGVQNEMKGKKQSREADHSFRFLLISSLNPSATRDSQSNGRTKAEGPDEHPKADFLARGPASAYLGNNSPC